MDFDSDPRIASHEVRLFPTIRISSSREAELRATAALLAMVRAVSEFGRVVVKAAGGPAGRMACFTEVPIDPIDPAGKVFRPDGIIRAVRGSNDWKALVEVKVGDSPLDPEQVSEYHRLAREHDYNALITISNQAAQADGSPPVTLDGRRLRAVPVLHFSWDRLLSEAKLLSQKSEVADADQAWMLEEWIKYVTNPDARIIEPPQLTEHWSDILRAAREANLPSVGAHMSPLAAAWDAFLRKEALRLRSKLGADVEVRVSRSERKDPASRQARLVRELNEERHLRGELRVPDAASDLSIEVGLVSRTVRFGVALDAPEVGRQRTRLNWLAKQLRGDAVPEELVVKVEWDHRKVMTVSKAGDVRDNPDVLLRDGHQQLVPPDSNPKRFTLEWTRKLQKPKGRSTAPVLAGISDDLEDFYGRVVEGLVAYVPPAPKLPKQPVAGPSAEDEARVSEGGGGDLQTVAVAQGSEPLDEGA